MSTSERRTDRALTRSRELALRAGREIRVARRGAGLSLRAAARAVGLDHARLARLERGELPNPGLRELALACAATGLELSVRAYPAGPPVRDAAHLRVLARLRARLPPGSPWRIEVPVPIAGDLRAFDAGTVLSGLPVRFEVEVRLEDVQALSRRVSLKIRDAQNPRLILVVADTAHNRRVLREHRELMRPDFPLDSRAVLGALARGVPPPANGIVIV